MKKVIKMKKHYDVPSFDDGDFTDVNPIEMPADKEYKKRKNQYRFNAGDIVVYENDDPQYKYRVIEFMILKK